MSATKNLDELKRIMRQHGGPGNPSIEKLEAEVRSDAFLPITRSAHVKELKEAESNNVKS